MSERNFKFVAGEHYHIYNRGNSKQKIFLDSQDHQRFTKLLYLANSNESHKFHLLKKNIFDIDRGENIVSIGAYCLMPNHFHILVSPQTEEGLSRFMQKLSTGYSMYFNNKYKRSGTLFEGKFKAEHVNDDRYLQYLYAYIHLNPMKLFDKNWKEAGVRNTEDAKNFIRNFRYSSFQDYLARDRVERHILNGDSFPVAFDSPASFEEKIFDWLETCNPEHLPML